MYIYIIIPSCKAGFEKRSVKPLSEGKTGSACFCVSVRASEVGRVR